MPKANTNAIGDFGELLAATDLSRTIRGRYRRPLFKPTYLGQKYPSVDFIVDVLNTDGSTGGFFFVQVKSTSKAGEGARIRVSISPKKYNRLASLPAPTYLIGVDTRAERTYLVAALKPIKKPICVHDRNCTFSPVGRRPT
jgi:hypothetical protein